MSTLDILEKLKKKRFKIHEHKLWDTQSLSDSSRQDEGWGKGNHRPNIVILYLWGERQSSWWQRSCNPQPFGERCRRNLIRSLRKMFNKRGMKRWGCFVNFGVCWLPLKPWVPHDLKKCMELSRIDYNVEHTRLVCKQEDDSYDDTSFVSQWKVYSQYW